MSHASRMLYLQYVFATTLALLVAAASINYFADPSHIFRPDLNTAKQYVVALRQSKHGLWWPSDVDDRAIKLELTKYSGDVECVVVGSSHVMEIGSMRPTRSLIDTCSSILNLAVGGASIEDHFTLVYLALTHGHPRKIVLDIDPWTFAFGEYMQWTDYSEEYRVARQAITGQSEAVVDNSAAGPRKFRNLFSLEYTIRSLHKVAREVAARGATTPAGAAPAISEAVGGESHVIFPDGSSLSSAAFLIEASNKPIPIGGVMYKTDVLLNDPSAIQAYKSLLIWIKSNGVEPILLLTPYHQNVWAAPNSVTARSLRETEPIVRSLARDLGLTVIGTYDPNAAGCLRDEFLDYMHAKSICLARLDRAQVMKR
jgi:hypothetical protein